MAMTKVEVLEAMSTAITTLVTAKASVDQNMEDADPTVVVLHNGSLNETDKVALFTWLLSLEAGGIDVLELLAELLLDYRRARIAQNAQLG